MASRSKRLTVAAPAKKYGYSIFVCAGYGGQTTRFCGGCDTGNARKAQKRLADLISSIAQCGSLPPAAPTLQLNHNKKIHSIRQRVKGALLCNAPSWRCAWKHCTAIQSSFWLLSLNWDNSNSA